eukprot:GHVS01090893.1.p1 GENE.GHVS01090893.1~~GHVS01090893.1.p1  ORF type:complete len:195 (+),score=58.10 GHVS01090893.1:227-811(+)
MSCIYCSWPVVGSVCLRNTSGLHIVCPSSDCDVTKALTRSRRAQQPPQPFPKRPLFLTEELNEEANRMKASSVASDILFHTAVDGGGGSHTSAAAVGVMSDCGSSSYSSADSCSSSAAASLFDCESKYAAADSDDELLRCGVLWKASGADDWRDRCCVIPPDNSIVVATAALHKDKRMYWGRVRIVVVSCSSVL